MLCDHPKRRLLDALLICVIPSRQRLILPCLCSATLQLLLRSDKLSVLYGKLGQFSFDLSHRSLLPLPLIVVKLKEQALVLSEMYVMWHMAPTVLKRRIVWLVKTFNRLRLEVQGLIVPDSKINRRFISCKKCRPLASVDAGGLLCM